MKEAKAICFIFFWLNLFHSGKCDSLKAFSNIYKKAPCKFRRFSLETPKCDNKAGSKVKKGDHRVSTWWTRFKIDTLLIFMSLNRINSEKKPISLFFPAIFGIVITSNCAPSSMDHAFDHVLVWQVNITFHVQFYVSLICSVIVLVVTNNLRTKASVCLYTHLHVMTDWRWIINQGM